MGLDPCCNGNLSKEKSIRFERWGWSKVLILVVMEIFRKEQQNQALSSATNVLILVVMEIFRKTGTKWIPARVDNSLDPCCNGNLSKELFNLKKTTN